MKAKLLAALFLTAMAGSAHADLAPVTYSPWLAIDATDPTTRWLRFQNAGVDSWGMGSNGSDTFFLARYVGGTFRDYPLQIAAATGYTYFADQTYFRGNVQVNQGVDFESTIAFSGGSSPANSPFFSNIAMSGSAAGGEQYIGNWGIVDSVAAGGVLDAFRINHQFGGAALTGGRVGLQVNESLTSPTGNPAGQDYIALADHISVGPDAGTSLTQSGAGSSIWGANIVATLGTNAAHYRNISGIETNVSIETGASVLQGVGDAVISLSDNVVEPLGTWAAFMAGSVASQGKFKEAYQIGSPAGTFPLDPSSGVGLGVVLSGDVATDPGQMAWLIDGLAGTYGGGLIRGPGFRVDGAGNIQAGDATISATSTGAAIDVAGNTATAVAVASGGSNARVGAMYTDVYGGIYFASAISGGAVTALTMYRAPMVPGAPPSNPVTLTADGATGLAYSVSPTITANLTWAAKTVLGLSPSGGKTTVGGPLQLTPNTPASSSAACTAGQISVDASYIYACTATNTWKRAALSAF